ncbi:hypothetical protein KC349_g115 [Hortaea werneckii]|nr:hypothetical protein KC349_g115 [Hortaea werneckii]
MYHCRRSQHLVLSRSLAVELARNHRAAAASSSGAGGIAGPATRLRLSPSFGLSERFAPEVVYMWRQSWTNSRHASDGPVPVNVRMANAIRLDLHVHSTSVFLQTPDNFSDSFSSLQRLLSDFIHYRLRHCDRSVPLERRIRTGSRSQPD